MFEANNLVLDYVYDWTMKQVARLLSSLLSIHTHSAYIRMGLKINFFIFHDVITWKKVEEIFYKKIPCKYKNKKKNVTLELTASLTM